MKLTTTRSPISPRCRSRRASSRSRIPERNAQALLDGEGDLLLAATVQDPGNAGALVRIAAAAGFKGVVADMSTADFFSPKAVRGSAGAVLRVPALRVEDLAEFAGSFAWEGGVVLVLYRAAEKSPTPSVSASASRWCSAAKGRAFRPCSWKPALRK